VQHWEDIVEIIEMDVSLAIFGVQNQKISVAERGSVKRAYFLIRTPFDANYSFSERARRRACTYQRWTQTSNTRDRPAPWEGRPTCYRARFGPSSGSFLHHLLGLINLNHLFRSVWSYGAGTASRLYKQPLDPRAGIQFILSDPPCLSEIRVGELISSW
jgi:hypothetical protein